MRGGYANWQAGWSTEKKAWCCQHQAKGCPDLGKDFRVVQPCSAVDDDLACEAMLYQGSDGR